MARRKAHSGKGAFGFRKADNLVGLMRSAVACCALLLLLFTGKADGQTQSARITLLSTSPARVRVEGASATGEKVWSFRNAYAGILGLGERIESLSLRDQKGASVVVKRIAPGEYEAASDAAQFSYEVKLDPPARLSDAAFVSWLTGERGFLLLGDLLPQAFFKDETKRATTVVHFELPQSWSVKANELKRADGEFEIADPVSAVFFAGRDLRERLERVGTMQFSFIASGDWAFTDEEASSSALNILKEHAEMIGGVPRAKTMLMLAPFPSQAGAERWSAETRGATVILLSGRSPSKIAGLAQLSVPLTHELFHLWIPNALALDGDYDWFYEGFTSYQAMRAGLRLRLLTFQDYLNALGRAYDAYLSASERDKLSLLEASQRRWSSSPSLVYSKGLLVAYLYDLTLRQRTKGGKSLDDVYRELFRRYYHAAKRSDGNAAVIAALNNQKGMEAFTRDYVESAAAIDLASSLSPFGLKIERVGVRTRVSVADSITREQRDLLRKLGYNTEARAAAETRKRIVQR
ncbi:MAG: hypothetical protein WCB68_19880 [Pyrinomonadaceae bacterium]